MCIKIVENVMLETQANTVETVWLLIAGKSMFLLLLKDLSTENVKGYFSEIH